MKRLLLAAALGALCLPGEAAHAQAQAQADPAEERHRHAQERYEETVRAADAAQQRHEAELAHHRAAAERARRQRAENDRRMAEHSAYMLFSQGQTLASLNNRTEACRVYDQLARFHPNMPAALRTRLPEARRAARCSAATSITATAP